MRAALPRWTWWTIMGGFLAVSVWLAGGERNDVMPLRSQSRRPLADLNNFGHFNGLNALCTSEAC